MSKDFTQGFTTRTTSGLLLPAICMLGGCAVYHLPTSVCEAGNMAAKKKKKRERSASEDAQLLGQKGITKETV